MEFALIPHTKIPDVRVGVTGPLEDPHVIAQTQLWL